MKKMSVQLPVMCNTAYWRRRRSNTEEEEEESSMCSSSNVASWRKCNTMKK